MLKAKNVGLLIFLIKRRLANSFFKGNKHYDFFIRQIKTDLNNHSYVIKQTTAIPKEKSYSSPISFGDIGRRRSTGPLSSYKQGVFNKLVTHYSTKKGDSNSSSYNNDGLFVEYKNVCSTNNHDNHSCCATIFEPRNELFCEDKKYEECIKSDCQEGSIYLTQLKQKENAIQYDAISNDSDSFSLATIKEVLRNKINNTMKNSNINNIVMDDIVILNQKIPERESLIFFKNKDLYFIESSHTNFSQEVKKFMKKQDIIERNTFASERLNSIRFFKVTDCVNELSHYDTNYSKAHFNSYDHFGTEDSWESLNSIALKVKHSIPLENNTEKEWIPYEDDRNNYKNTNMTSSCNLVSPHGPPFTEKVPINKDKLIEETVVPNTSILNIINSIDKSAVIIQKDLYITDQIIQKIQKEEEQKNKVIDKNKLETSAKKNYALYLDTQIVKNGMVTVSLTDLTAGIKKAFLCNKQESLSNSDNKPSINTSQIKDKFLKKLCISIMENEKQTNNESNNNDNNNHNDLAASVTLDPNDGGRISFNMYKPIKIVPLLSFLMKQENLEKIDELNIMEPLENIVLHNNHSRQSDVSQSENRTKQDKSINFVEPSLNQQISCKSNSKEHLKMYNEKMTPYLVDETINNNETTEFTHSENFPKKNNVQNGLKEIISSEQVNANKGRNNLFGDKYEFYSYTKTDSSENLECQSPKCCTKNNIDSMNRISAANVNLCDSYSIINNSSTFKSQDVYHQSTNSDSRLKQMEKEFLKNKKKNNNRKMFLKSFYEKQRYIITNNNSQGYSFEDNSLNKENKYDSHVISHGEGMPMEVIVNNKNTITNLQDFDYQLSRIKNSEEKHKANKFPSIVNKFQETLSDDNIPNNEISASNINIPNNGIPINNQVNPTNSSSYSQDNNDHLLIISQERLKRLENELLKLKKITNESEKKVLENFEIKLEKSMEKLFKDFNSKKKILNLKNESEKKSSETSSKILQNTSPGVEKPLELKELVSNKGIMDSIILKNKCETKSIETPTEESSHRTDNMGSYIEKPLELKELVSNKGILDSIVLKNKCETKSIETSKEESSHRADNMESYIEKSLEYLSKDFNLTKEILNSNLLKNESKKKYVETPKEEFPDHIAQIVQAVTESLRNLLKDRVLKNEKSESEANLCNKGILTDNPVNLNCTTYNSHNENYQLSNITNTKLKVEKNDFMKQKEITNESEKTNSTEKSIHSAQHKMSTVEKLKTSSKDYFQKKERSDTIDPFEGHVTINTITNTQDIKISEDNKHDSDNTTQRVLTGQTEYPQINSLQYINEVDKYSTTDSLEINNDVKDLSKNNTHPNLTTISNNEFNELMEIKNSNQSAESSLTGGSSGKDLFNGRKNVEKLNNFASKKKKFENFITNETSVDHFKKTTISSVEKNDFTDIKVSEVETFVDSRLPIPFSTETFYQIFGSNHSLRDHSSVINVAKHKLTTQKKITDYPSNLSVMAKLDDIHKSVKILNNLNMNRKSLENKESKLENKDLVSSIKVPKSSSHHQDMTKHIEKDFSKTEIPKNQNVPNFIPNFPLNIFSNKNLPLKANTFKQTKTKIQKQKNTIETQDQEASSNKKNSLLVLEPKNENVTKSEMGRKKPGIQKVELTGIKGPIGKYIDLFNTNKNEKNRKHKIYGFKKGVYNYRGLSKRDRNILREITKEAPKNKPKAKTRRRPIRLIISKKPGNEFRHPIKSFVKNSEDTESKVTLLKKKNQPSKKDNESVDKTELPNIHLSNKPKLLPSGKHDLQKNEVKKNVDVKNTSDTKKPLISTEKVGSMSYKSIPKGSKLSVENKKSQTFNLVKKGNMMKGINTEKHSLKNTEPKTYNSNNEDRINTDKICKKPICQTYVATETYIHQAEGTHLIPQKIFSSKKVFKNIPKEQKVTVFENSRTKKDDKNMKIHEGFKEDLIRKSQHKIEHKSNIDFRVRTPKIRNPKSKVTIFKSLPKDKINTTESKKISMPKKDKKKSEVNHLVSKKHLKSKSDHGSSEIKSSHKPASIKNMKNEEPKKNPEQLGTVYKETPSLPNLKAGEIKDNKPIEKIAQFPEKSQDYDLLKTKAIDKSMPSQESIIEKEIVAKKKFPMFLIDVDKMSKEIKPELDVKNCQKCQVPIDKITEFPLHNQKKKLLFKPPFEILNHGSSNDTRLLNELKFFPSVTKILNSTIPENSRETLREWRKSMIEALGESGFKSFYKGQLINGNKFNSQLHNYLSSGEKYERDPSNLSVKSIENVLKRTSDLCAVNSHVIHRKLSYRGVIDCVAKYHNKPVLIEWKRLENPQVDLEYSSIEIAATQLSAYIGAVNYDDTYKFQLSGGLIVLAYNDGSEAEIIEVGNEQCYKHWQNWLRRLQTYQDSSRMRAK